MSELARQTAMLGGCIGAFGVACALAPAMARRALTAFPRSRVSAWVLTALVMSGCGSLLYHGPLGFLEAYRNLLFVLVPVAVVLVGLFVDDLLAPRALGGLLVLLPAPLLQLARWEPSPWRYAIILAAYAMVLGGSALIVAPYLFRLAVERVASSPSACRVVGAVALVVGGGFLGLALSVIGAA